MSNPVNLSQHPGPTVTIELTKGEADSLRRWVSSDTVPHAALLLIGAKLIDELPDEL